MFRCVLLTLSLTSLLLAENYHWPIKASQSLSSTFCEYRSGHLHAGIDIKTWGEMEVPLLSISSGYIEQILVGYNGYGRGLFVRLKDGNTAVYGHLERFIPEIETLVQAEQMEQSRYTLRMVFPPDQFPVESGQVIAFSGTSGTEHPHLHFEIRDSLNQAVNPQLFFTGVKDTQPPRLDELLLMPATSNSRINGSRLPFISNFQTSQIPITVTGQIKFAVNTHDRANGTFNKYNIYRAEIFLDDSLIYSRQFDQIPMKFSNRIGLVYPGTKGKHGWRFMSMFSYESDSVNLFSPKMLTGVIEAEGTSTIKVVVSDISGNLRSKAINIRQRSLDSWVLDRVGGRTVITRHYSNNAYERYQFFSEMNTSLPVAETLYRLHSTTWIITKQNTGGIRAVGTISGDIRWVIPPQNQSHPQLEYIWVTKENGFVLQLTTATPYIFPLTYQLEGKSGPLSGMLIQTSDVHAETNIIPLRQRCLSEHLVLQSDTTVLAKLNFKPWEHLTPSKPQIIDFPEFGYTLKALNNGDGDLFLAVDTMSLPFDGGSLVGISLKVLGDTTTQFSGTLTGRFTTPGAPFSFFSLGKKGTLHLEKRTDSPELAILQLNGGGNFFLFRDDSAPIITPVKLYKNVKQGRRLVYKIDDNTGIIPPPDQSISASLNGSQFFVDYNPLRKEISFHAPLISSVTQYELKLSLTDESGNTRQFTHLFATHK